MAVTILIPAPLRRFAGGARSVAVEAATVTDALDELAAANPDLRFQIFDDTGKIRSFVNVFLGDENVNWLSENGSPVPVRDGDVITLLPAIAGGSATGAEAGLR